MGVTYVKATKKPKEIRAIVTTTISLPKKTLTLLRRVALVRAEKEGGRNSVSRVIQSLVSDRQAELMAELKHMS
jgi:hypothetical protein